MNTPTPSVLLLSLLFLAATSAASAQKDIIASWNFNDISDAPDTQFQASVGSGSMTTNWALGNIGNNTGTSENLLSEDTSGRDIAFSNGSGLINEGGWLQFEFSMAGYKDLEFSFAGRTTDSGFQRHDWSWSINDETFHTFATLENRFTTTYSTESFSLALYEDLNYATNVYIRVALATAAEQTTPVASGNNRFDNVHFYATSIPEPSVFGVIAGCIALTVVIMRRRRLRS